MENNIDEKMPDKLYKYMPWRWVKDEKGNNRNYARELIENNEFYLQSPKNFNDPFDSKVYPSVIQHPHIIPINELGSNFIVLCAKPDLNILYSFSYRQSSAFVRN